MRRYFRKLFVSALVVMLTACTGAPANTPSPSPVVSTSAPTDDVMKTSSVPTSSSPTNSPTVSPVSSPSTSPISSPLVSPSSSPKNSPVVSPSGNPTSSPVVSPAASPANGSDTTVDEKVKINAAVFFHDYTDTSSNLRSQLGRVFSGANIKFQNYDAGGKQRSQNDQIDEAIKQGANLLIVNLTNEGAVTDAEKIINKAKKANVSLIFFDCSLGTDNKQENQLLNIYENTLFLVSNDLDAGHAQGRMIADYLLANYDKYDLNGDGAISYVMFKGDDNNAEATNRTKFSQEDIDTALVAAGKPALVYFDPTQLNKYQVDENGAWSSTAASSYMSANLKQYNKDNDNMIELVICNNDNMAYGAISALNEAGYNLGNLECVTIPVFGVDGNSKAWEMITKGKMAGTVKRDDIGMAEAIGFFVKNVRSGKNLRQGIETFNQDPNCPSKVFFQYAKVLQ